MYRHMQVHSGVKKFIYPQCNKMFNRMDIDDPLANSN